MFCSDIAVGLTICHVLLAACVIGQEPWETLAPDAATDLRSTISAAHRNMIGSFRNMRCVVRASCAAKASFAFSQPVATRYVYESDNGIVRVAIEGVDLDSRVEALQAHAQRAGEAADPWLSERLFLPGGLVETKDAAGSLSIGDYGGRDPRECLSWMLPNEWLWSFCGEPRAGIFATKREPCTVRVQGAPGQRRVWLDFAPSESGQGLSATAREDWGWMCEEMLLSIVSGDVVQPYYRIGVGAATETRLGHFPAAVTMWLYDLKAAKVINEVAYQVVEVAAESRRLPSSLAGSGTSMIASPYYAKPSDVAVQDLVDRDQVIDRLLQERRSDTPLASNRGQKSPGPGLRRVTLAGGLVAGATGLLLLLLGRGKRRLAACVLCWAAALAVGASRLYGTLGADAGADVVAADETKPPSGFSSKWLCGLDVLYGISRLAPVEVPVDYLMLSRLLRPGRLGVSLLDLQKTGDCIGLQMIDFDPEEYRQPPWPSILHLREGHFVLVVDCQGPDAVFLDSQLGLARQAWSGLQRRADRGLLPEALGN